MKTKTFLRLTILALAGAAMLAGAQTPYDEGQKALRAEQWMEAARHFEDALESDQPDAAMYWRAYALYKADHRGDAARQIRELESRYPHSRWLKEAKALQVEYGGSIGDAEQEDQLRLYALSNLIHRDQDRALPLVMEILENTPSESVRRDALFVLAMSDSAEAREYIARVARSNDNPELQAEAIQVLGAGATESSLAVLQEIFYKTDSEDVREAVIHAHIMADKPQALVGFLESGKSPESVPDILHALGAMEATDTLRAIYPTLTSREARVAAIEAFSIADETGLLREVLDSETDPELRRAAIQGIAISDEPDAAAYLESIYESAVSHEEKAAVLESLTILEGGEDLALKILREETDPVLQRHAIQLLGMLGATEELARLYETVDDRDLRIAALESMAIAGNTEGILRALETEQDPEIRTGAIHALAIDHEKPSGATERLVGLYSGASHRERMAVIESLAAIGDADSLIRLLEKESDPELKQYLVHALSSMDSEEASEYLFRMLEEESKGE